MRIITACVVATSVLFVRARMINQGVYGRGEEINILIGGTTSFETPLTHERGKGIAASTPVKGLLPSIHIPIPLIQIPKTPSKSLPYFSQIDVVVGIGRGIRLGCNPGELLDFLLGWTTVDIFNDDLEARKAREESNHRLQSACGGSFRS